MVRKSFYLGWNRGASAALIVLASSIFATSTYLGAQQPGAGGPPAARRDPNAELALKISAPFTIAAVGDIIEPLPITVQANPNFESLIKVLRGADVSFANMESSLVDMKHFEGPIDGTLAPAEVGQDLKAMGFTIMNRANNHAYDGTELGMNSTDEILDKVGIVHAGSGKDLEEARGPQFMDTPKGRVGIVGMFSADDVSGMGINYNGAFATYRLGNYGGKSGIDPLRITAYQPVSPDQLQTMRSIAPSRGRAGSGESDQLNFFGRWFKAGQLPAAISYQMNPDDEKQILQSVRSGKVESDFMIATIHAHQGIQHVGKDTVVSDYLQKLAHESVDNGADIFITHGPHEVGPVEIYKGKPIFYGLSSFIFQIGMQISEAPLGGGTPFTTEAPTFDPLGNEMVGLEGARPQEGILATCHYDNGKLTEVRLYPMDLGGLHRPMSQMGIGMTPSPERAKEILAEVQGMSTVYGTKISVEDNVGVIRVEAGGENARKPAK